MMAKRAQKDSDDSSSDSAATDDEEDEPEDSGGEDETITILKRYGGPYINHLEVEQLRNGIAVIHCHQSLNTLITDTTTRTSSNLWPSLRGHAHSGRKVPLLFLSTRLSEPITVLL
ncbi:hypothetical protein GQR58_012381 [Nymphon striatum]|nr:hypothetical protein GQR58_012381 [Nymphon striatum]